MANRNIKRIIGDYQLFFFSLYTQLNKRNVDITGMPLSHLCYRVSTELEYKEIRDQLKDFCSEFVETQFNGRSVSILILKTSLVFKEGFTVSVIELPASRASHTYPSGLEHVGVLVGKTLPAFNKQYKDVLTGTKDHGINCKPSFISFNNGKTVKFYDHSLKEIVLLEGWEFQSL